MLVPINTTPDTVEEFRKQYDQSAFAGFSDMADPTYDDTYALSGLGALSPAVLEAVRKGAIQAALMAYDIRPVGKEQAYTTASYIANRYVEMIKGDAKGEYRPEKILEDARFSLAVTLAAPGSTLRSAGRTGSLLAGNTKWVVLGLAAAAAGWYFWKKRGEGI